MILHEGNKVLVVHRRLFETDRPRFFVGTVDGYEAGVAKVSGFSWVKDQFVGKFVEKENERCKIVSLSSGTLIVYQLPNELNLATLTLDTDEHGRVWLTDRSSFKMDLTEREYRTHPRASGAPPS